MTSPAPPPGRRRLLGLMAAMPSLPTRPSSLFGSPGGRFAAAPRPPIPTAPFPEGATLLVAGPEGGRLDQWARLIVPGLGGALPPGTDLRLVPAGGADGVTGANRFAARTTPDGSTLLLAPGESVLAWLVGDPRAKFDVGNWVPVLAGVTPGVVIGRIDPASLRAGRPVRLAVNAIEGPDLALLLGVDLLGAHAVPVGPVTEAMLPAALAQGRVELALLRGERVRARLARLAAAGARPLFSLGALDSMGAPMREPAFPALASFEEVYAGLHGSRPAGSLYHGWRAVAVASRLAFGLVLGALTAAAMVALWRRAGAQATASREFAQAAAGAELQPLPAPAASAGTAPIAADMAALLALRQWLNSRFNWRPT